MRPTAKITARLSAFVLAVIGVPAQAFDAEASLQLTACGGSTMSDGGNDVVAASVSDAISNECSPGETATASGSASAEIASGTTMATASASGPAGANRALARSAFQDFLFIDAPAGVDSVDVMASIDLTADYTGAFDFSNELLFGRVIVESVGLIEIRRCTPILCPGNPIQSDSIGQVFTVPRSTFTGQFPQIVVDLETAIDVVNGGGVFNGSVSVELLGNTGAVLTSDSGVFGTGGQDTDGDGIADDLDNCIEVPNPAQRDTNGDGYGNFCDADLNDDGTVNAVDLGLLRAVYFTADADADFNGDGVVNVVDLGIMRAGFFLPPGPSGIAP